jgi:muramoyltetrapeptide carboxypeptidase
MKQTQTITPPYLQPGDVIGITAPARKVSRDEMAPAIRLLEEAGFVVKCSTNLYGSENQFSGTDAARIADINELLSDAKVKAIIAARGGYGCMRIVDGINWDYLKNHPKWIVGYSDMTAFHAHIHQHIGLQTVHGTMPINFLKDAESTQSLLDVLSGKTVNIETTSGELRLNREGIGQGDLIGGNLSLLYAIQNSASDIDYSGKVLFIEDLDEYLYHVDRMILSLKRAGKLKQLAGLVVGGMDDMKDNTVPFGQTAEEIIRSHVEEYNYPVAFGFPAGHGTKNLALKMGAKVQLSVSETVAALKFI